jgi:hypothetical protein
MKGRGKLSSAKWVGRQATEKGLVRLHKAFLIAALETDQ